MATYRKPSLPSLPPRQKQPNAMPASALPVLPTSPPGRIDSHTGSTSQGNGVAEYVVALYDFTARDDNELSCKAGDRIRVISREIGEGWIQGALGSVEGRLPTTYVEDEH
ncbi:Protein BZZ1 [Coemansia erecta]|nr:Protein BZZ1 [Coemansia erecta]